jgi:hypothetical protein
MKKTITILGLLLIAFSLFAKGFNASDLMKDKKVIELIESHGLENVYSDEAQDLFRSKNNDDWVYIFSIGNEDNSDNTIITQIFVYVDGIFESCQKFGQYTGESITKYMWASITETTTVIQEGNKAGSSSYAWTDPKSVFVNCFNIRLQVFLEMLKLAKTQEFVIPEAAFNRYQYFLEWFNANKSDKNLKSLLPKEYRNYLKENKQ